MEKYSPKYDTSIRDDLDDADWDDVYPRVLKYAVWYSLKYKWLGEKLNPEDLVEEAVSRAYGNGHNGTYRNWNKTKYPELSNFLIGIVKSLGNHLVEHEKGFPSESLSNGQPEIQDRMISKKADEAMGAKFPKTPEVELLELEALNAIENKLETIASQDDDLEMLILCIVDGICAPRLIADETGFKIDKVYSLLKKLRRRLSAFKPDIKN